MAIAYKSVLMDAKVSGSKVVVTCDPAFAGKTISCTKSGTTLTQVCPSTSPYTVTFEGLESGTWTISGTVQGQTFTTTAEVQDVSAVLSYGFVWTTWVDTAKYLSSSDYNSLDEVLADEEAVRELMLEHACVDYLSSFNNVTPNLEKIIENDLCAKWINLCDYALDTLYANAALATVMDTADKYFYGEWVIVDDTTTPPTWGAKGNVPIMTSNIAPYGECISNGTDGTAYNAFDNNDSTESANSSYGTSGGQRLGYKFANPVNVKKLHHTSGAGATDTIKVQYSDDGITWTDTGDTFTNTLSISGGKDIDVTDSGYHLYWGIYCTGSTTTSRMSTKTLQFYGRELSVSVPTMTGNTTPYGEASASSVQNTNFSAFKAFDNDTETAWQPTSSDLANSYIQYEFPTPICVKRMEVWLVSVSAWLSNTTYDVTLTLQGINDGVTEEIQVIPVTAAQAKTKLSIDISNNKIYKKIQLKFSGRVYRSGGGTDFVTCGSLQFYGLDYSEKEFEAGTTKKWLYDHGVELETIHDYSSGSYQHGPSSIYMEQSNSGYVAITYAELDTSLYDLVRAKVGSIIANTVYIRAYTTAIASLIGGTTYLSSDMPNNGGYDISAVNGVNDIGVAVLGVGKCELEELWLE